MMRGRPVAGRDGEEDAVAPEASVAESASLHPKQVKAIIANTGWLFADRLVRMVGALFVGIWFARYLGPELFGTYNYAGTIVAFLGPFVTLGLDDVVVRDLVRHPGRTCEILGSAFVLKLGAGAVCALVAAGAIAVLRPADGVARLLVGILSLGMILQAFDAITFYFRAAVTAKYGVYARNAAFLVGTGAKIVLLMSSASVTAFVWATVFELALGSAGLVAVHWWTGGRVTQWRASRAEIRRLARESWPLVLSGVAIMIYMRIDVLMLGQMRGSYDVGIYATATRISELWYFIPTAIASSVAPSIIKAKAAGEEVYFRRLQYVFDIMSAISISVAAVVTLCAKVLIIRLFGPGYTDAGPVLAVHVWAGCFVFLGVARQTWIVAEGYTREAVVFTSVGALSNVLLNCLLIPRFGPLGAAVATVMSYGLSDYVLYLVYPPFKRIGNMMTASLLRPWPKRVTPKLVRGAR